VNQPVSGEFVSASLLNPLPKTAKHRSMKRKSAEGGKKKKKKG
jgi:hypothetical protein